MADPHPNPDGDPGVGPDPGTPRWVKAFGLVALVLVALVAIVHLAGGGLGHHVRPSGSTERDVQRP